MLEISSISGRRSSRNVESIACAGRAGGWAGGRLFVCPPARAPAAMPQSQPTRLTPARRLTPVALSRGHDALLRELHHQRRQLLAARRPRALPLRVARDGRTGGHNSSDNSCAHL